MGTFLLLAASTLAWAGPCDTDTTGIGVGPVTVGFLDGDLGVPRRVCGRSEVAFAPGGSAVVDTANFYGHIVAGGTFDGSWAPTANTEVYASVEAVRYDSVITPISASYLGFGHVAVGATQRLWTGETAAIAVHGRVVAPTAVGLYQNAWPLGLDVGVAGTWAPVESLSVHADVGGLGSAAVSAGPAFPRGGARVTVGAAWHPVRPFALVLDVTSGFGYTAPVDVVAGSLGVRVGVGKRVGIELGAAVPLVGRERALAAGELKVNVRLGKLADSVAPVVPVPTP
jgi:hypothetical protein